MKSLETLAIEIRDALEVINAIRERARMQVLKDSIVRLLEVVKESAERIQNYVESKLGETRKITTVSLALIHIDRAEWSNHITQRP